MGFWSSSFVPLIEGVDLVAQVSAWDQPPPVLIDVRHQPALGGRDEQNPSAATGLCHVIENLTDRPVWFAFRGLDFEGRVSCGMPRAFIMLAPRETKKTITIFTIGKCPPPSVLREMRDHSNVPERRRPLREAEPRHGAATQGYVYYVEAWRHKPCRDDWWNPVQVFQMDGVMRLPPNTPSRYCMHYYTETRV